MSTQQYAYSRCPETGRTFTLFPVNDQSGKWGVARINGDGSNYSYLTEAFGWVAKSTLRLATSKEAEQFVDRYVKQVLDNAVPALVHDKEHKRLAFRCPACQLIHKIGLSYALDGDRQVHRTSCFRAGAEVFIRLYDVKYKAKKLTGDLGVISMVPKMECKECWGTGEYVGFALVQPCSTCFPKPQ